MGIFEKIKSIISTPFSALEKIFIPVFNKLNDFLDKFFPQDKWNWKKIAIVWALTQFIIVTVMEIIVAKKNIDITKEIRRKAEIQGNNIILRETSLADPITVYHMIFIVAQSYQAYLIIDTITKSSTIQLFASTIFNFACSIYSVVQYLQEEKSAQREGLTDILKSLEDENKNAHPGATIEKVLIALMVVFCLGWAIITLRLYKVFGWNVFKQLGADIGVKNRLKLYQILLTSLKIDIFFFTGFSMQFLVFVIAYINNDVTIIVFHVVLLIIIIIMPLCGFTATKKENFYLMSLFIFLLSISIGYMIYNLTDILYDKEDSTYRNCKNSLTYTSVSSIVLGVLTYILAIANFRNFPKGLKKNKTAIQNNQTENPVNSYGTPKRWSIE